MSWRMTLLNSLWISLNQDSSTGMVRVDSTVPAWCSTQHTSQIQWKMQMFEPKHSWWQPHHSGHGLCASLPKGSALLSNKIYTTRQLAQGVQKASTSGIFLRMSHLAPADIYHQKLASVDFRLLLPRDSSALGSIPQWVARMKEPITG